MGTFNNQACFKGHSIGLSSQNDHKALMMKIMSMQHIEPGEVKMMPTQSLHSYMLAFLLLKATLHTSKGETQTSSQLQTFHLQ